MYQVIIYVPDNVVLLVALSVVSVVGIFQAVKWLMSFIPAVGT